MLLLDFTEHGSNASREEHLVLAGRSESLGSGDRERSTCLFELNFLFACSEMFSSVQFSSSLSLSLSDDVPNELICIYNPHVTCRINNSSNYTKQPRVTNDAFGSAKKARLPITPTSKTVAGVCFAHDVFRSSAS